MLTTVAERYSSQYSLHKTHVKPKSDVGLIQKEAGKYIVHVFHDQEFVRMLLAIKSGEAMASPTAPLPTPMHVSDVIPSSIRALSAGCSTCKYCPKDAYFKVKIKLMRGGAPLLLLEPFYSVRTLPEISTCFLFK